MSFTCTQQSFILPFQAFTGQLWIYRNRFGARKKSHSDFSLPLHTLIYLSNPYNYHTYFLSQGNTCPSSAHNSLIILPFQAFKGQLWLKRNRFGERKNVNMISFYCFTHLLNPYSYCTYFLSQGNTCPSPANNSLAFLSFRAFKGQLWLKRNR
jgi:hypothetical protein